MRSPATERPEILTERSDGRLPSRRSAKVRPGSADQSDFEIATLPRETLNIQETIGQHAAGLLLTNDFRRTTWPIRRIEQRARELIS